MNFPILSAIIFIPLIGAIFILITKGNQKILDKVGEKWSAFQTINFKNNSQPYYVLLSPELELLNKPLQYTDTETYYTWLAEGLKNFNNKPYFLK